MQTITDVRQYLTREQAIAGAVPGSPEYQVFTLLLRIAHTCETIEAFLTQAREMSIEGPQEESNEARAWLRIALATVEEGKAS